MLFDRFRKKSQKLAEKKSSHREKERVVKVQEKIKAKIKDKEKKKKEEDVLPILSQPAKTKEKQGKIRTDPLILKSPQITEKAVDLQEKNQYVFKVSPRANKTEVKKAVEDVFNVDVLKVRVINIPAKRKRLGKTAGWQKGYKKAIVCVKKGQNIEILPR